MINYDPGTWGIAFAFTLQGSVFPKALVWAVPCAIVSMLLHAILHKEPVVASQVGAGDVGASVLAGFTFILGFLVVFRSQQAYSRWWEGGTLLQQIRGEWFNAFSSLVAFCNQDRGKEDAVLEFQHQLARLSSLLYCTAIQQVSTMKNQDYELIDIADFDAETMSYMLNAPDKCEVCLQWIQRLIGDANDKGVLKVAPPILSRVYNQLGNGIVMLNNARKIKDFPIPFPLAQMITFMMLLHWVITALVCAASVEKIYWAGILSFIVTFSFWGITYIAVELEQPYGDDANDLPLHRMQRDMNASLQTLVKDVRAQRAPKYTFKKEHQLMTRASEPLEKTFQVANVEIPHVVSPLPDLLVTGATGENPPPCPPQNVPVTDGMPQVKQEGSLVQPKRVVEDAFHMAAPPLQNKFHGREAEFTKRDAFPESLPPSGQAQADTHCWETNLNFSYRNHACISKQPSIEEFASPGPAVKLVMPLPPCDTVVSAGVDHPSATAWQRVAQRCVESGSGSGDAMPTSIVTPLPRYP